MHGEYIEICPVELRKQIQIKGFTHADLALRLNISTKSVQRWLNQTIKRMKVENLRKLAEALEVSPDTFTKQRQAIRQRTVNKSFEDLSSEQLLFRTLATDDWERYTRLLASFNPQELSTNQEAILYKNLGLAACFRGKMKASKKYLDQAYALAESIGDIDIMVSCLIWQCMRCKMRGDLPSGYGYAEKAESMLTLVKNKKLIFGFKAILGLILMHSGRIDEAIAHFRISVAGHYREDNPNIVAIAFAYVYLAFAYMRKRDFKNAKITTERALRASQKAGWVKGHVTCNLLLGVLTYLTQDEKESARGYFGKGRSLKKCLAGGLTDSRIDQLEFLRALFQGNYQEAKMMVADRLMRYRQSHLFLSYAILDALFLARLQPGSVPVRWTLVDRAADVFAQSQCHEALQLLNLLKSKAQISFEEFMALYIF